MRTTLLSLTALATVLVTLSPPVLRAQEGILVTDFSTPHTPVTYPLAGPAKVRRGVTSTVEIVKNLIDLVPFDQIKIHSGPTTISSISNGRTSASGTGFIRMSMTVPSGLTAGSTVTLDVGFLDHFSFTVLHEGQLSNAPALSPSPGTVVAGSAITVTGHGVDFGSPNVVAICHNVTMGSHDGDSFTATLVRSSTAGCVSNNGPFTFSVHGSGTGDPTIYSTVGGTTSFQIPAYQIPAPPPGLACASVPNIDGPVITRPVNQQVFSFAQGANARQQINVIWHKKTTSEQSAPNNDWLVSIAGLTTTVRDTVFSQAYLVPGTYTLTIRAKNCDTPAQSSSVSFSLKFQ